MDEVFVEPFDGSPPEREPNDPSPEREGKFLEAETMIALNDLCGRVWDKWLSFGAFQTMEPGVERLGYQINIYQMSRRQINRSNAAGITEGGFSILLQLNPDTRFFIDIYNFIEGGMHYLKTTLDVDAGGMILSLSRSKARDDKFFPKPLLGEKPGILFCGDSFSRKIEDETGVSQFFIPLSADADERAEEQISVLKEILANGVSKLSIHDRYNTRGAGKDLHPDVGYGSARD